jgi:hypothetical protein
LAKDHKGYGSAATPDTQQALVGSQKYARYVPKIPQSRIAPTFFFVNNNSYDYITIIIGFDNDILKSNK